LLKHPNVSLEILTEAIKYPAFESSVINNRKFFNHIINQYDFQFKNNLHTTILQYCDLSDISELLTRINYFGVSFVTCLLLNPCVKYTFVYSSLFKEVIADLIACLQKENKEIQRQRLFSIVQHCSSKSVIALAQDYHAIAYICQEFFNLAQQEMNDIRNEWVTQ